MSKKSPFDVLFLRQLVPAPWKTCTRLHAPGVTEHSSKAMLGDVLDKRIKARRSNRRLTAKTSS